MIEKDFKKELRSNYSATVMLYTNNFFSRRKLVKKFIKPIWETITGEFLDKCVKFISYPDDDNSIMKFEFNDNTGLKALEFNVDTYQFTNVETEIEDKMSFVLRKHYELLNYCAEYSIAKFEKGIK